MTINQDKMIEWAINNLNAAYVKVAPSPVHGVGVFAMRDIPKDTLVMRFDYRDFPCVEIKKKLLKQKLHPDVYSQLIKNWAVTEDGVIVPVNVTQQLHFVNFLNHSDQPNIRFDNCKYYSTRKIAKDEEIFIDFSADYNPYGIHFKVKKNEAEPE